MQFSNAIKVFSGAIPPPERCAETNVLSSEMQGFVIVSGAASFPGSAVQIIAEEPKTTTGIKTITRRIIRIVLIIFWALKAAFSPFYFSFFYLRKRVFLNFVQQSVTYYVIFVNQNTVFSVKMTYYFFWRIDCGRAVV